jgi:hypothetical protein
MSEYLIISSFYNHNSLIIALSFNTKNKELEHKYTSLYHDMMLFDVFLKGVCDEW